MEGALLARPEDIPLRVSQTREPLISGFAALLPEPGWLILGNQTPRKREDRTSEYVA